jgi:hypothetical protein
MNSTSSEAPASTRTHGRTAAARSDTGHCAAVAQSVTVSSGSPCGGGGVSEAGEHVVPPRCPQGSGPPGIVAAQRFPVTEARGRGLLDHMALRGGVRHQPSVHRVHRVPFASAKGRRGYKACRSPQRHVTADAEASNGTSLFRPRHDCQGIVRREHEYAPRPKHPPHLGQTAEAGVFGMQIVDPIERKHDRVERCANEQRQISSVSDDEIHVRMQPTCLLEHRSRVVEPHVSTGYRNEKRRRATRADSEIEYVTTARNMPVEKRTLARRQVCQSGVRSYDLRRGEGGAVTVARVAMANP